MSSSQPYSTRNTHGAICNGDRMNQPEFHESYERTADGFRAELIAGIVYVSEPVSRYHGNSHSELTSILRAYRAATPGVESCSDTTVILGKKDEVQPDVLMRILPEYSGQSQNAGRYVQGAPELVAEIACSSKAIDLHMKKQRYANAGVIEYIVVCLEPNQLFWFDLRRHSVLAPDANGVIRSNVFPGLWINSEALMRFDHQLVSDVLNQGLSSPEHQAFVARLKAAHSL